MKPFKFLLVDCILQCAADLDGDGLRPADAIGRLIGHLRTPYPQISKALRVFIDIATRVKENPLNGTPPILKSVNVTQDSIKGRAESLAEMIRISGVRVEKSRSRRIDQCDRG